MFKGEIVTRQERQANFMSDLEKLLMMHSSTMHHDSNGICITMDKTTIPGNIEKPGRIEQYAEFIICGPNGSYSGEA